MFSCKMSHVVRKGNVYLRVKKAGRGNFYILEGFNEKTAAEKFKIRETLCCQSMNRQCLRQQGQRGQKYLIFLKFSKKVCPNWEYLVPRNRNFRHEGRWQWDATLSQCCDRGEGNWRYAVERGRQSALKEQEEEELPSGEELEPEEVEEMLGDKMAEGREGMDVGNPSEALTNGELTEESKFEPINEAPNKEEAKLEEEKAEKKGNIDFFLNL